MRATTLTPQLGAKRSPTREKELLPPSVFALLETPLNSIRMGRTMGAAATLRSYGKANMRELTCVEVTILARATGFELPDEELVDIMHQLNVIIAGVSRATHPELDTVDPLPICSAEQVDHA